MTQRGYTRALTDFAGGKGCVCPEEFEHDGKCPNGLRERDSAKCAPCSSGWHLPYPCNEFVPKSKGQTIFSTQCARCGWDSIEHPLPDDLRALEVPLRRSQHT